RVTMKARFCCNALLLTLGLLSANAAQAEDVAAKLKDRMAAAEKESFSGAVIVTREGRPLLCEGYRFANIELEARNTPQTKFRLGSITKQFTAMAVMILQEREKLN